MDNVVYNGEHSITFVNDSNESRNTWTDWGLVPSSRYSEPISSIWSNEVTANGLSGQENLLRMYPHDSVNSNSKLQSTLQNDNRSYLLLNYGYDIFQPKSGSFSFIIADQEKSYFRKVQEILDFLHNQTMKMRFSDIPSKIFVVRTTVDSSSSGETYSSLDISYSIIRETVNVGG